MARFINHSCAPNLLKQTVLIEGDHGLKHRIAFFTTDVRRPAQLFFPHSCISEANRTAHL